MRRIALISEHASPLAVVGGTDAGGQNIYVAQLAAQLARSGYAVDVFTRRDRALLRPVVQWKAGVRVVHVPAGPVRFLAKEDMLPHMDEFARNAIAFFRSQPDAYRLVHANFFMSGMVAQRIKRALDLPFVITFHALGKVRRMFQGEADRFPARRMHIEEELVRDADGILAECPQDLEDLRKLYGADPRKVSVVPCGFDPAELACAGTRVRADLCVGADEFVVLQLGRLVPRKGIDNVIRALAALDARHGIRARLLVVGGNAEHPSPEATPEIGRLTDIARSVAARYSAPSASRLRRPVNTTRSRTPANVFVTTPWYEPFGITPVEAMACGVPVIGSAVGGIKYTVVDGRTGFLVPANDPEALAERLARLQRNPELARAMGREGQRRARQLFTWRRVAAQVAELYRSVAPQPDDRLRVSSAS